MPLNGNDAYAVNRALEELCESSERDRAHLPTINGLILGAALIHCGHNVSSILRARIRKTLTNESFGRLADTLLGPP